MLRRRGGHIRKAGPRLKQRRRSRSQSKQEAASCWRVHSSWCWSAQESNLASEIFIKLRPTRCITGCHGRGKRERNHDSRYYLVYSKHGRNE